MFVRRKHNKSGTTSIQVVAKDDGKYRVEKSFGSSRDEAILASLEQKVKCNRNGKNGADCYSKNGHAVTVLTRQSYFFLKLSPFL